MTSVWPCQSISIHVTGCMWSVLPADYCRVIQPSRQASLSEDQRPEGYCKTLSIGLSFVRLLLQRNVLAELFAIWQMCLRKM